VGGIDLCPDIYYGEDLHRGKVGESEVVRRGEGEDVAFACYGGSAEEEVREVWGLLVGEWSAGREYEPEGSPSCAYSAWDSLTAL
jgi:hypothetical protein